MGQAFLFGAVSSGALVLGATLGSFRKPPDRLLAAALAETHKRGGPCVCLATVAGFLVAYAIAEM